MKTLLLLAAVLCGLAQNADAQIVASVANLSGVLTVRHADGSTKLLSVKSQIDQGDTLITEKNTFAQLKFLDASTIVLRPASEVRVDKFSYDQNKPEGDSLVISLIKGGMRAASGLIGKRNREVVQYVTPTATIGIRGTEHFTQIVEKNDGNKDSATGSEAANLPPGLYHEVVSGTTELKNDGGSIQFTAGQAGYVKDINTLPIVVPANTNTGTKFAAPPSFKVSNSGGASDKSDKGASSTACAVN